MAEIKPSGVHWQEGLAPWDGCSHPASASPEEQNKACLPVRHSHGDLCWKGQAAVGEEGKMGTVVTGEQTGTSGCEGTSRETFQGWGCQHRMCPWQLGDVKVFGIYRLVAAQRAWTAPH